MQEREMLELAAKAAGIDAPYEDRWGGMLVPVTIAEPDDGYLFWNSRTNSDDALALAAKLHLSIDHNHPADQSRYVSVGRQGCEGCYAPVLCIEDEFDESERVDATRRAITRAAAEIGKAMP